MDADAGRLAAGHRLRRFLEETVGILLLLVAALAFAGLYLDIEVLTNLHPGFAKMKPNTALCLALDGSALLVLLHMRSGYRLCERLAAALSATAAVIAFLTVLQDLLGADFLIDRVLLPAEDIQGRLPGRMSPVTAASLLLLSLSLAIGAWRPTRNARVEQSFAALAGTVALVSLLGYLLGVPSLYAVESYRTIALHTASLLVLLSLVLLLRRSSEGWMAVFTAGYPSAVVARRMLAVIFVVLPVIAWLRMKGESMGLYDTPFGLAIMVTACLALLTAAAWYVTRDANRIAAELQQLNNRLEEKVAARTAELRSANEQLEAFSYTVAHDLRAPLRVVDGYCDVLAEEHGTVLGSQGGGIVRSIREAARSMSRLIDGLLRFAQVGKRDLNHETIDMGLMVAEVCSSICLETGREVCWAVSGLPPAQGDAALIR